MTQPELGLASAPGVLLVAAVCLEGASLAIRRVRRGARTPALTVARWALRPWAVWAAFNLVFRRYAERGFNNPRTFPFYANLWRADEGFADALRRLAGTPSVWGWGAVVLGLTAALLALADRAVRARQNDGSLARPLLCAFLLAAALPLAVACLPDGIVSRDRTRGTLLSSWTAQSTMLYTIPHIRSTGDYLRRFTEIQPALRRTIHGITHPPGASLSLYWIGRLTGAAGRDIRDAAVRLRYAVGLTVFGACNVFLLFLLGRRMFDSGAAGLLAALLWLASPATGAYASFAQDSLYAVFFNASLLLSWTVVTGEERRRLPALLHGVNFFLLAFLTFSWTIAAAVFAGFLVVIGLRRDWPLREYVWRAGLPFAVAAALSAILLAWSGLDYLAVYRTARAYVAEWYVFRDAYQWCMALVGGQVDLWLMMGSVTCSAFLVGTVRAARARPWGEPAVFLTVILAVYAVPLLFGPACLKMETSRCWNWIATVPLAFAARELLRREPAWLFACGALAVSVLSYAGMRLFLNFGA